MRLKKFERGGLKPVALPVPSNKARFCLRYINTDHFIYVTFWRTTADNITRRGYIPEIKQRIARKSINKQISSHVNATSHNIIKFFMQIFYTLISPYYLPYFFFFGGGLLFYTLILDISPLNRLKGLIDKNIIYVLM